MAATRRPRRPWVRALVLGSLLAIVVLFAAIEASPLLPPWQTVLALRRLNQRIHGSLANLVPDGGDAVSHRPGPDQPTPHGKISLRWHRAQHPEPPGGAPGRRRAAGVSTLGASVPAAVLRAAGATVRVIGTSEPALHPGPIAERRERTGLGTVVWRGDSSVLVVTAAHVLGEGQPQVSIGPGRPAVPGDLIARDESADLALVRVSSRELTTGTALRPAGPEAASIGAPCWTLTGDGTEARPGITPGIALGQPADVRASVAYRYGEERARLDWFVLSPASRGALGGSPVLSRSGEITGILIGGVASASGSEHSLAIGAGALTSFLHQAAPREMGR
jgi:S1-C subfamily serine protease